MFKPEPINAENTHHPRHRPAANLGATEILRSEYGIDFNMPKDGGGVVIGDKVAITFDIQAAKA